MPHCPAWDAAELVRHTGGILSWISAVVESNQRVSRRALDPAPENSIELAGWYLAALGRTLDVLGSAHPDFETWTFSSTGDNRIRWWCRRLAVEVAIHCFDIEHAAAGEDGPPPTPVNGDVAAANDFADIAKDAAQPVAHSTWAEAAALVRHDRACEIFYERLEPFSDLHQSTGGWYLGATARYLGLLSDALGFFEDANGWFAQAERKHEMMDTPPWLARGRLDWAEALMRRGETEHANQMAHSALQVIGDLELNVSRSRAETLLRND